LESLNEQRERIAVWIFGFEPLPEEIIGPILWGLEEEGIPGDFRETQAQGAEGLAKLAADGSPLNVGIGIDASENAVALHHRDLPHGMPLFLLTGADLTAARLRRLGANAARLVKGEPLVLRNESTLGPIFKPTTLSSLNVPDEIAALVLAEILSNKSEG
jgi:hypothetical protein